MAKRMSETVIDHLVELYRNRVLNSDQAKHLLAATRQLEHSIKTSDRRKARKAIAVIARTLLKSE